MDKQPPKSVIRTVVLCEFLPSLEYPPRGGHWMPSMYPPRVGESFSESSGLINRLGQSRSVVIILY